MPLAPSRRGKEKAGRVGYQGDAGRTGLTSGLGRRGPRQLTRDLDFVGEILGSLPASATPATASALLGWYSAARLRGFGLGTVALVILCSDPDLDPIL